MRKERFLILLVFLLSLIALRPLFIREGGGITALDIFTIIMFLSCINAVSDTRRHIYIASILLCLALAARFLAEARLDESIEVTLLAIYDGLSIIFLVYTSILILGYVVRGHDVTRDRIAAAICVYLMLGIIFGAGYRMIYTLDPNAFKLQKDVTDFAADKRFASDFTYYSFVTLTTLGYGDITPKSYSAESIAILEAVIGQLFIAVLIACLVGMYIAQKKSEKG